MKRRSSQFRRGRGGYALPAVLMFLSLGFAAWVLMYHSSGTLIRVEQARLQRQTRSAWTAPAMGAALRLLESGNPPLDTYQCKISVTDSGVTKYFIATYEKQTATRWTVNCTPTDANSAVVTAPDTFATTPAAPTNLLLSSANSSQVSLSWDDVLHDIGYSIERSLDGSTGWTEVGTVAKNVVTYTDTTVAAGTLYYYRVRAIGSAGYGSYSAVVSITSSSTPAMPTNFAAIVLGTDSIGLSWTDNSNSETGFRIQRSVNGLTWSTITTASPNATSYTDTGLVSNKTYYYRMRADGASANSAYTGTVSAKTN